MLGPSTDQSYNSLLKCIWSKYAMLLNFYWHVLVILENLILHVFIPGINAFSGRLKPIYPREIANLFNELRHLTEEVNSYYVFHVLLLVIEIELIFISGVTSSIMRYVNIVNLTFFHNKLFLIYCVLKLLFLFVLVRETHKAKQQVSIWTLFDFLISFYSIL